ncbi:hypothetical protein CHUAL_011832 [Chamberlinius hualienensis]
MSKSTVKEKDKSLQEKLKNFLGIKNPQPQTDQFMRNRPEDYVLTAEILRDISSESSVNQRIRSLKRLAEEVHDKYVEMSGVEAIWVKIRDLLEPIHSKAVRQSVYEFVNFIIVTQYDRLDIMRPVFFKIISNNYEASEDLVERLELLNSITKTGREIDYFEDEMGPFLLFITNSALESPSALEFLKFLVNILKFHSAFLDKPVVGHVVSATCSYTCRTSEEDNFNSCLNVLEALIGYSWLPVECLEIIVPTLCRTVNVKTFCSASLKLARDLLGTHLGYRAFYTMCNILEQPANREDTSLIRGAVFYTVMCLWGSQRVNSLKISFSVLLPYLSKALDGSNIVVAVEVGLSLLRLVSKYGETLHPETWDLVLTILEDLIKQYFSNSGPHGSSIKHNIHQILSLIELLYKEKQFSGSESKLFALIGKCSHKRPENSVIGLLNFQASSINPLKVNWLGSLKHLIDTFYRQETRTVVRNRVLEILGNIYEEYRHIYEDDIVEKIIIPCLNRVECDEDVFVRKAAVELLLMAAQECTSKFCLEMLEILDRIVTTPFDQSRYPGGKAEAQETVNVIAETEIADVKTAILGLIQLFDKKMYELPSSIFISVFKSLVKHLHLHYDSSVIWKDAGMLRVVVFECLLRLRADELHHLGLYNVEKVAKSSPYLLCIYSEKIAFGTASPPLMSPTPFSYSTATPTYISLDLLFQAVTICLKQERDWSVLKLVLLELPKMLQNKTLMLSSPGLIGSLCQSVCALISDRSMQLPETLRNAPVTLSRPEFHMHVYPIQVALVSYHKYMEENVQKLLVSCLKHGLTSKCAPTCISALSICLLEMNKTMNKVLPAILLSLSKISATTPIANSVLQFLSTLIRFPNLYASFVQEQYMSIFAIAMPYTNPFKFHHFTVSLAHHVIAMWFIKCRITYRRDFVRFIVKGLKNNVLLPLTEGHAPSEDRSRSDRDNQPGQFRYSAQVLTAFHHELVETCIDLLTRYTFAGCSAVPKRGPIAEFLLTLGQSATWIIGNSAVTITTSGCNTRTNRLGLCDKCLSVCKKAMDDCIQEPYVGTSENVRRRHRSAAVRRSLSIDSQEKVPRAKDDLQILRMRNRDDMALHDDDGVQKDENKRRKVPETEPSICSCWCKEWAEVLVRRPTGNTSWMMRIQNLLLANDVADDFPLSEISNMIFSCYQLRHKKKPVTKFGHERIDSEGLDEIEYNEFIRDLIPDMDFEEESAGALSCSEEAKEVSDNHSKSKESPLVDNTENPIAEFAVEKLVSDAETPEQLLAKKTENLDKIAAVELGLCTDVKQEIKVEQLGMVEGHARAEGGAKPKGPPLHLPDVMDRQMHSPVYNIASAPLSPLPLHNSGVYEELQTPPRDRCNTIAVMSPVRPKWFPGTSGSNQQQETHHQSINPSFVFLQLYHSYRFGTSVERPVYVPKSELSDRALKVLDHIPPYDTYKIGVLYVAPNQVESEAEILANQHGSVRYMNFLQGLGHLVHLKKVNPKELYVGGLDLTGPDGQFTYVWKDDVLQVVFHVATLMPTKVKDPSCNEKKRHIGNDFVSIIYNNSGQDYNMHTIKGQFIYACVVIQPLDCESNLVTVKTKPELSSLLGSCDAKIVSDSNLAVLVRQLALYANLAALVLQRQQRSADDPYASNWVERQRNIKRMREKHVADAPPVRDDDSPPGRGETTGSTSHNLDDFTRFV